MNLTCSKGDKNKPRTALCATARNISNLLGHCNKKRKCLYRLQGPSAFLSVTVKTKRLEVVVKSSSYADWLTVNPKSLYHARKLQCVCEGVWEGPVWQIFKSETTLPPFSPCLVYLGMAHSEDSTHSLFQGVFSAYCGFIWEYVLFSKSSLQQAIPRDSHAEISKKSLKSKQYVLYYTLYSSNSFFYS